MSEEHGPAPDARGWEIQGRRVELGDVADYLPALISYVDSQRRFCCVNAWHGTWFGVDSGEIPGMGVEEFFGPELYASMREHVDTALSGKSVSYEIGVPCACKRTPWVAVRYWPDIEGGRVRGFFALMTDITDKRRVEQKLSNSAQQASSLMQAILEAAVEGIITIDEQGIVESINPAAQAMFGYAADEVCGNNVKMLMPRPFCTEHDEHLARYREQRAPLVLGTAREVLGRRRDGSTFPMEISVSEVTWNDSRRFAGIVRDLTERRRLEQEFLQAQKMEAIGRLAGSIAHDFNNLVMGVIGGCRLAASKLEDRHPARSLLEDVSAEAERGAGLIRQLLTFSRKHRVTPKCIEINDVFERARRMIERLVGEDIAVRVDLAPGGGSVVVDPVQIEQVLMNLVVNARDAMSSGGQLSVRTTEVDIEGPMRPGGLQPGSYVALVVQDTGVGMDSATMAKVFEPFFTTKGPGEGTGLGLSTVYGIVKRLGGDVAVESKPGQGSTFTVLLPRDGRPEPALPDATPTVVPGNGETILVVEDEGLVRAAVRYALENSGYRVFDAVDADQAKQVCAEHGDAIDLLLADIVLPGLSGPQLAREIVQRHPGIATLYMSAYPHDHLVERGKLEPDQPSLEKPFTDDVLLRAIRDALAIRPASPAASRAR